MYDCIILGAGIAGLTAARNLQKSGYDVIVLEGSNRNGGRIKSIDWGSYGRLELGAELIHRTRKDIFDLWRDVFRYKLKTKRIDKPDYHDLPAFFRKAVQVYFDRWDNGSNGFKFGLSIMKDPQFKAGLKTLTTAQKNKLAQDLTIGTFIHNELCNKQNFCNLTTIHKNAYTVADLMFTGTVHGTFADQSLIGTQADDIYGQETSEEEYHVVGGFGQLIDALARDLTIVNKAHVTEIERVSKGVNITTKDGYLYEGKTCICTFSIGQLKTPVAQGGVHFKPGLTPAKRKALNQLGIGPVNKIAIEFHEPIWPSNKQLSLITAPGEPFRSFFFPFYGQGKYPVMTALLEREHAIRLDQLMGTVADRRVINPGQPGQTYQSNQIVADIVKQLGAMFGRTTTLADVKMYHAQSWGNDPFSRGGTSYIRYTGASADEIKNIRKVLATPDGPLHWAGEATAYHKTNPYSVHGAHSSGILAAKLTDDFLQGKPLKMPPVRKPTRIVVPQRGGPRKKIRVRS